MVDTNELRAKLAEQVEHYQYHGPVGHKAGVFIRRHGVALLAELDRLMALDEPVVRTNEDGSLDEVVGTGWFHLEQMDSNKWWMQLGPHMVTLTARGKISAWFGKNEARLLPAGDGGEGM